jgi:hypothetical protein
MVEIIKNHCLVIKSIPLDIAFYDQDIGVRDEKHWHQDLPEFSPSISQISLNMHMESFVPKQYMDILF